MRAIRATLQRSDFFQTHEVIGSSLLFVHDRTHASIWMIDFAKTVELPENVEITHNRKWSVGTHEDGYLIGINNLIEIFEELLNDPQQQSKTLTPSSSDEKISGSTSAASSRSHSIDDTITQTTTTSSASGSKPASASVAADAEQIVTPPAATVISDSSQTRSIAK